MTAGRDTHEPRQPAIWPWVLMPLVVLLVALALNHFKDVAQSTAAQAHSPATATAGGTGE
jgi:hypothetical protein